ncbi:hypothetical protein BCR36DRAFT_413422 [Piromyces finnis]|uniref:Dickkopf N-terminal cysteine-rich domain-containing protein n=1 Tax=Piromyces finnis TaxID=1754191 RepID=A0A1Y1V6W6_9FUNG|nr:hypothetical protein BCR36DRAFT_413422 [Piromyces finnis]|eukprot:ORX47894.1 hypothetical protein BCR36DRAFT_413422 [Piromyces finnis]
MIYNKRNIKLLVILIVYIIFSNGKSINNSNIFKRDKYASECKSNNDCSAYQCIDGYCNTSWSAEFSCSSERDCPPLEYCSSNGKCEVRLAPNRSCTSDNQCMSKSAFNSGYCVSSKCSFTKDPHPSNNSNNEDKNSSDDKKKSIESDSSNNKIEHTENNNSSNNKIEHTENNNSSNNKIENIESNNSSNDKTENTEKDTNNGSINKPYESQVNQDSIMYKIYRHNFAKYLFFLIAGIFASVIATLIITLIFRILFCIILPDYRKEFLKPMKSSDNQYQYRKIDI